MKTTTHRIPGFLLTIIWVALSFYACKKAEPDRNDLYLKVVNNDSLNGYFDNTIKEIIPLPDNTFWIHYRIDYFNFYDRFEHYDENFKLLKTVHHKNYLFGKFIVRGNNDIVVSAGYKTGNSLSYHFIRFDNDFNVVQINSDPAIKDNLRPMLTFSFDNFMTMLKNGQFVFGFYTNDNYPGKDSARIVTALYKDPLTNSLPDWVDRSKHVDPAQGIKNSYIVDIAADEDNHYYILGMYSDYSITLRKHDVDGKLIWQKKIPNKQYIQDRYTKIQVESDRVVVYSTHDKVYLFDLNGNYVEKKLTYGITGNILPTLREDGYIAVSDTIYSSGKHATMLKFDRNFNLLKVRKYGNQGTNKASAPRLERSAAGKILVAGFVETANLNEVNLMLFKLNDELELVE